MLTIGLNSVVVSLSEIGKHAGRSFVEAYFIDRELQQFVAYLSFFELSPITYEEASRHIIVSEVEIEGYRYQNGGWELIQVDDEVIHRALAAGKEEDLRRHFDYLDRLRAEFNRNRERFAFYLVDTESGQVHTNLSLRDGNDETVETADDMLYVIHYPDRLNERLMVYDVPGVLPYREEVYRAAAVRPAKLYTGWAGVPKSEKFLALHRQYERQQWYRYGMLGAGAVILAVLAAARRRIASAASGALDGLQPVYRKIPADIRLLLFVVTGLLTYSTLQVPIVPFDRLDYGSSVISHGRSVTSLIKISGWRLGLFTLFMAAFTLQLWFAYRSLKEREPLAEAWRSSVTRRAAVLLRDAFLNVRFGMQAVMLSAAAFLLGFAACLMLFTEPFEWLAAAAGILAAAVIPIIVLTLRQAAYLNRLLAAARGYAEGRIVSDIPVRGKSVLAELAGHWNRMRRSAEASRASEAKSERLKTELITNVSHDLRTPLTSVISYVELLKRPDLTEDERASYITVIDQKSKRLKVLIDDLFEATKMASGSVELNRERVDLVQLIEQALAESGAKAEDAGIEFRVKLPQEPVYAFVDGKNMWRVFDNLISNMLRYSLEGSRAYIALRSAAGRVEIEFKNVAKYELGDNVDELIERFKRGDASRHTEGSGLGLAIAKSIVDLHGGTFELEVDGDLFKVKVLLAEAQE